MTRVFIPRVFIIIDNYSKKDLYSIHYINGDYINSKDITIDEPITFPDKLHFYSQYNIKPSDFVLIKKKYKYSITNYTYLGQLYVINFVDFNLNFVDKIFWKNIINRFRLVCVI